MLRPVLAFLTLCLAAFLLAPTVASVHTRVTDLHFDRELPWNVFKWNDPPKPHMPPTDCGRTERHLYSEITQWPAQIRKDEKFNLRGVVQSAEDGRSGVRTIEVDLFLNETKTAPGVFLGKTESDNGGYFDLMASVPFDLQASHYHIVAHAKEKQVDCKFFREHWSDPETEVVSKSHIEWLLPEHAVVGREVNVGGRLLDSVGAPVRNATLNLTVGGRTQTVVTANDGSFFAMWTPARAGNETATADFRGTRYYEAVRNVTSVSIASEDFVLADPNGLSFQRSTPLRVSGSVYVAPDARQPDLTLRFAGTRVATCLECPPTDSVTAPVGDDGAFAIDLVVPPSEPGASGTVTFTGGGLQKSYAYNVSVDVPTAITLDARGSGFFSKGYEADVRLVDEAGRPLVAPVALRTPAGWTTNSTSAEGTLALSGTAACGTHVFEATFNGSDHVRPASAAQESLVCGWMAYVPPWLLAVPWWVWPLVALVAFAAWKIAWSLRQKYAPVILSGPALALVFTEPRDDAAGYAGIGEAVVATAFLEEPLPDGHRLRMGTSRETEERPLDAELRAHLRLVPDKLGSIPVRAEIVDAKGRVVSRRTVPLHVVRYAEEIERRYLALRASSGAKESVTPREFERWLHERAPGLDPTVTRHLVHVFEEADYSPRVAGRADFAAYLAAEKGVEEVRADATLA